MPLYDANDPASIRYYNPGAMYPGPSATRFGSTSWQTIGGGHKIAVFPDAQSGAAAQFDLLNRSYTGMPLSDAVRKWSGGNSSPAYMNKISQSTGLSPSTVLTPELLRDPSIAIPFAKAAAQWEAGTPNTPYPLSDEQWRAAHQMALGAPVPQQPQPPDGMDAASYGSTPPASPMGAPRPMPIGDAAPDQQQQQQQQQPGYFDRLMVNPMFMAGLSILGTKPGGDWGPNAANASANTLKMAMAQNDFQRKQQSEAVRDKVWNGAFPGGRINPDHPLTKGIPPDLLASVYAMGPDAGVPELAKLAMFTAEGRQKMLLQQQMGDQMARAVFGQYGSPGDQQGQPTAQPDQQPQMPPQQMPPQTASIPAAAMPAGPAGTTMTGPGPGSTMSVPASAVPTMPGAGPIGGQPQPPGSPFATPPNYNFRGGTRSNVSGQAVLGDPDLRRIMYGHIMAGKPDEAMKAYQSALEKAQAPRLAGETKYAQETADNQAQDLRAQQSFREAGSLLDKTERAARSLGDARLNAAASPTLDTWTGQNVQRHFQPQAYADRQQLLPYLEQMTVLARQQLKGQGSLSDQENAMLQKALTGARNATDAPTFYQQLNVARSILATKLPEMRDYVPPQVLKREAAQQTLRVGQQQPEADAGNLRPLQPPSTVARTTDRLDEAGLEGRTVYDKKTGRWGMVTNGEFIPRRSKIGTVVQQQMRGLVPE